MNRFKKKLVVIIMCVASFLCMIDTTIMVVSLPKIETYMNVPLSKLSWALNLYTIIFAVFTVLLSRLAEIKGKNKIFICGLIIFTIGSFFSASASNCNFLIISRGVQGLGAAIILPLSTTIAIGSVSLEERNKIIGILGGIQGLGAAVGPALGGFISQYLGWRWIFFINIPFLAIVTILSLGILKIKNEQKIDSNLDIAGSILSMIFLFSLVLGIIKGNDWGWTSNLTILLFVIAVIAFVLFIICEQKVQTPMVNFKLFRNLEFNGAAIIFILVNFFLVGVTVVLPTYLTKIQDKSEITAALLITPISLVIAFTIPIVSKVIKKIKSFYFIFLGFIIIGLGYYLLANLDISHNYNELIFIDILLGLGAGFLIAVSNIAIASNFKGELLTASQSVGNVLRQLGIILAIAIFLSTLTMNIDKSKQNILIYGKQQITELAVSNTEKEVLIDRFEEKFSGNNIEQLQNTKNIIKTKIQESTNFMKVQVLFENIEVYAKHEMKDSFLNLYRDMYVIIFIASLSFIIFVKVEKKKNS